MISSLIENASKQKLFRSFTKYGSDMLELLSVYRQKNNQQINSREHDYINELLLFLLDQEKEKAGKVSVQPQTKLIDVLSGHEYKVLRLMAGGMTNPEIASELSISVNTVKTHCANIYGKLGVNNRTQAVNRGKLLGLL
ncbi:MAG: response regulator transcription factor [Anaerolineaceae bacterium]|nr:response regulator transcription factor [Anaerolineaceae bacterium]